MKDPVTPILAILVLIGGQALTFFQDNPLFLIYGLSISFTLIIVGHFSKEWAETSWVIPTIHEATRLAIWVGFLPFFVFVLFMGTLFLLASIVSFGMMIYLERQLR